MCVLGLDVVPSSAWSLGVSSSRVPPCVASHCPGRAVAVMDERSREAAEKALERAAKRAKDYSKERQRQGKKEINPNTYNVAYSAIILFTLNDLAKNAAFTEWIADGLPTDAVPVQAVGGPLVLVAYALFQLAFSFGTATSTPLRLAVTQLGVTEPPFSSALIDESRPGDYLCSSCGAKLFDASAKYDSGSGWPSFWRTHSGGVVYKKEPLGGRMEVRCQACNGHLGHVFSDGPDINPEWGSVPATDPGGSDAAFELNDPTVYPRFCINGAALEFQETGAERMTEAAKADRDNLA